MTPPPTDRNQALRDALEKAKEKLVCDLGIAVHVGSETGYYVRDVVDDIASLVSAILAMQEPASVDLEAPAKAINLHRALQQLLADPTKRTEAEHALFQYAPYADWEPLLAMQEPASEPAPASAPSCCDDMVSVPRDIVEKLCSWDQCWPGNINLEWEVARLREALRARAQPCHCGELPVALDYLFDTGNGCNGRPRIVDLCFTAFMSAKRPNNEDGGPSDWFTDTKPDIDKLIARMKERLAATAPRSGES